MTSSRILIAAPSSGSGKSIIASGLMAAFSRQWTVQGFKAGPDYIDPMYHSLATGRPSRNLDSWMLSEEAVMQSFLRASKSADLSVIEGVMGLFDGYGNDPFAGSTAALAKLLTCPVVLVMDCSKMSGSAAAVVHGMNTFSPGVKLSGVICNRVGSLTHRQWLKDAIETHAGIPVLGCVPRLAELQIPERHLGLFTVAESPQKARSFVQQAGEVMAEYIDLEAVLRIAQNAAPISYSTEPERTPVAPKARLAVARDEAFCFYYEDNLDALKASGAEIVPFSPIHDQRLPENTAGIYFGGGYPELYAQQLSQNSVLRRQILNASQRGMPILAECGGLMYLTEGICVEQNRYPMVSAVPGWCEMGHRLVMGYREVETLQETVLCPAGEKLKGHEFHYSNWPMNGVEQAAFRVVPRKAGDEPALAGFVSQNLLASYIHLHFAQSPQLARNFVEHCRDWLDENS